MLKLLFYFSFFSESDLDYQVVLGKVNLDRKEEVGQTIPVIQTIRHENYTEINGIPHNDVG